MIKNIEAYLTQYILGAVIAFTVRFYSKFKAQQEATELSLTILLRQIRNDLIQKGYASFEEKQFFKVAYSKLVKMRVKQEFQDLIDRYYEEVISLREEE